MNTGPHSAHGRRQTRARILWIGCGLLAMLFAGCATEVASFIPIGPARPPKPADYPIEIYTNGLPSRPFDRVATLDVHCESQGFMMPNLEHDAIPVFIKQARKAGCDAVIEIHDRTGSSEWSLETRVRHYVGTGIAYH